MFMNLIPKPEASSLLFLAIIIFGNTIAAYLFNSPFQAIAIILILVIPCRDKYYGNGRKYFWVRQVALLFGAVLCAFAGL